MSVRHLEECGVFSRDARCDCGATAKAIAELWPSWNSLPQAARAEALRVATEQGVPSMVAVNVYEALQKAISRQAAAA
jgi:hypothetical protein